MPKPVKLTQEIRRDLIDYMFGKKRLNDVVKKHGFCHHTASVLIRRTMGYGPVDFNWHYDIRMLEAEAKRKQKFTKEEIETQLY